MKKLRLILALAVTLGLAAFVGSCVQSAGRTGRWELSEGGGTFQGIAPSVSPDGKHVIYSSPASGHGDIYRVNIDGSNPVQLTDDPEYEGDARYSADGKFICFLREERGLGRVWVMSADGTGQRQVTAGDVYDSGPAFAPDGTRLVFARIHRWDRVLGSAAKTELWIIGIEGGEPARLTDNRVADWEASFSPDGRSIVYSIWSKDVCVMNTDGTDQRKLTAGSCPAYSPDGRQLAFINDERGYGAGSIWLTNANGQGRTKIYTSDAYKSCPSFLPDGSRILYLEEPWPSDFRKVWRICTIKTDGSDRKVVIEIGQ